MASIFGLIDFARPAIEQPRQALEKMAKIHGPTLAKNLNFYADGWAAAGLLPGRFETKKNMDNIFHGETAVVCLDGQIVNSDALKSYNQSSRATAENGSIAANFYHAYKKQGLDIFAELDGFYRIAIWDFLEKTLIIAGDRNGFWPIYFTQKDTRVLWGSEVKFLQPVLRKETQVNYQAVHDFIRFGYVFDGSTFSQGIEQLPAGHVLLVREDNLQLFRSAAEFKSHASYFAVDESVNNLKNAAINGLKSFNSNVSSGLLVSGGIDARLLAAASARLHKDATCLSWSDASSIDASLAAEVAKNCGYEMNQFSDPERYIANFKRTVWLADGLLDGAYHQPLNLVPYLRENPLTIFDGLQPLRGPHYLFESKIWRHRKWNDQQKLWLAEKIFPQQFGETETTRIFPEFESFANVYNLQNKNDRLAEITANWDFKIESPEKIISRLYRELNHRYFKSRISGLLRHFVPVYQPFYLYLYSDLVNKLPLSWQSADRLILRKIIKKLNPELLEIPWQGTAMPLSRNHWLENGKRGMQLIKAHYFNSKHRQKRTFQLADSSQFMKQYFRQRSFRQFILRTLTSDTPFSLSKSSVDEKFITRILVTNQAYQSFISRLVTVNLWYQIFVNGQSGKFSNVNSQYIAS